MTNKPIKFKTSQTSLWGGMAKQIINFEYALGELIDNSISAAPPIKGGTGKQLSVIEITIQEEESGDVILQVADMGTGVPLDQIANDKNNIFNFGYAPPEKGLMNEHGFGLKNALVLMTGNFEKDFEL